MTEGAFAVQTVGRLSQAVRLACYRAGREAGLRPAFLFLTGRCSAVMYEKELRRPLFVRWRNTRSVDWTYSPELFSRRFKKRNLAALTDILSDPATPHRRVICGRPGRRKMTPPVS